MDTETAPPIPPHLADVRHVAVLTSAGVSAESGLPTFHEAQTGLARSTHDYVNGQFSFAGTITATPAHRRHAMQTTIGTMRAVRMHAYGGPETLVFEDAPRPEPQDGEVLVQVQAASINALDWKIRDGQMRQMMPLTLPAILGSDACGTVAALGAGVTGFSVGQEVYGMMERTRSGAFAEYAIAKATALAPKPHSMSATDAASVPAVALTAWQALFDMGGLSAGQTVLVHGAAGGVGMFAVQLAHGKGARVFATASADSADDVKGYGADTVIDYKTTPFETVASAVDVVLDILGGDTRARSWGVLKPGGILVSTVPPPPDAPAARRGAFLQMQARGDQLREVTALLESGRLRTRVERVFPLAQTADALEQSKVGHARGKLGIQVA